MNVLVDVCVDGSTWSRCAFLLVDPHAMPCSWWPKIVLWSGRKVRPEGSLRSQASRGSWRGKSTRWRYWLDAAAIACTRSAHFAGCPKPTRTTHREAGNNQWLYRCLLNRAPFGGALDGKDTEYRERVRISRPDDCGNSRWSALFPWKCTACRCILVHGR